MAKVKNQKLEEAILAKNHAAVADIICSERLIISSVVDNNGKRVVLENSLAEAKKTARRLCKKNKSRVTVNYHTPFDYWREFIIVDYNATKLQWYYLHVDALQVK